MYMLFLVYKRSRNLIILGFSIFDNIEISFIVNSFNLGIS